MAAETVLATGQIPGYFPGGPGVIDPWPATSLLYVDDDAEHDPEPGDPDVSDPQEDGSVTHPFDAIQEAVDDFDPFLHSLIIVLDGTYTGDGNRDIRLAGEGMTLRSESGPETCIIDCEASPEQPHRGFWLEGRGHCIDGFTVRAGDHQLGGGIYLDAHDTFILNCILRDNHAQVAGGGIFCAHNGIIRDSKIANNDPDGMALSNSVLGVEGTVLVLSNDVLRQRPGETANLSLSAEAILELDDCRITCDVSGPGTLAVSPGSELEVGGQAVFDLSLGELWGQVFCQGTLRVKDNALVTNTVVYTGSGSVENEARLIRNRIDIDPRGLTGLVLKDSAEVVNNQILGAGDPSIWVDANTFNGTFANNEQSIMVEGMHVLEAKAREGSCEDLPCAPGIFDVNDYAPAEPNAAVINQLWIQEDSHLFLTDRFDDQNDGPFPREAVYVDQLVLDANAVLELGGCRLYYRELHQHDSARVLKGPPFGASLGVFTFDDPLGLANQVFTNNTQENTLVERVSGTLPDPEGMLRLRCVKDRNSHSICARVKARFGRSVESVVTVEFLYHFETDKPGLELDVYVSDIPELLDSADPRWEEHHRIMGRVSVPSTGAAGSLASGGFTGFSQSVSTRGLDLSLGTWVELVLRKTPVRSLASASLFPRRLMAVDEKEGSLLIDDWAALVSCGICMDLDWSTTVDEKDFGILLAGLGRSAGIGQGPAIRGGCFEGAFSRDGYIDSADLVSWDWGIENISRMGNLCFSSSACLTCPSDTKKASQSAYTPGSLYGLEVNNELSDLLVLSKRPGIGSRHHDGLYAFDRQGQYVAQFDWIADLVQARIVQGDDGRTYSINLDSGVSRINAEGSLVDFIAASERLYSKDANTVVQVGLLNAVHDFEEYPILDAVITAKGVYVTPVVVKTSDSSYLASARLEPNDSDRGAYEIAQLYFDDQSFGPGNAKFSYPREIEVDRAGYVYVLNCHRLNQSDMVIKFDDQGGKIDAIHLNDHQISDPLGMCISEQTLYLTSGQYDAVEPNATAIYGFATDDVNRVPTRIEITPLHHVTDITVESGGSSLWFIGYNLTHIPGDLNPWSPPLYTPALGRVDLADPANVEFFDIRGALETDRDMPLSIIWTGQ